MTELVREILQERKILDIATVIENAKARGLCMRWGCTTCGSGPFRDNILTSVGATSLDEHSARRIVNELNLLTSEDTDALTFLLRWTGERLGARKMLEMLGSSAAGDHYRRMLAERDAANASREAKRLEESPENVAKLRAAKAAEKQARHEERLRLKGIRDARLRAEGKL